VIAFHIDITKLLFADAVFRYFSTVTKAIPLTTV